MPTMKGTILFEFAGPPSAGFSESWSWQGTSAAAPARLNEIITARAEVLSSSWRIIGGRVGVLVAAMEANPSPPPSEICKVRTRMIQPIVCPTAIVGKLGVSDTPWAAVLIELTKRPSAEQLQTFAAAGRPREQQHRGIPDSWWTNAALDIPAGDLVKLTAFYQSLITTWAIGQVKTNDACEIDFFRYRGYCLKRISNRRVGRTFFQLRGRRSNQPPEE